MRPLALLLAALPSFAIAADAAPAPTPAPQTREYVVPNLTVDDSAAAIAFYAKAFGAAEQFRYATPDNKHIMYAEVKIGRSIVALGDSDPAHGDKSPTQLGGSTGMLALRDVDVDAAFKRAVDAGAKALQAPADMAWGGRFALVSDPFGYRWSFVGAPSTETKEGGAAGAPAAK